VLERVQHGFGVVFGMRPGNDNGVIADESDAMVVQVLVRNHVKRKSLLFKPIQQVTIVRKMTQARAVGIVKRQIARPHCQNGTSTRRQGNSRTIRMVIVGRKPQVANNIGVFGIGAPGLRAGSDVFGSAETAELDFRQCFSEKVGIFEERTRHRRLHESRADCVYPNAGWAKFDGHGLGQALKSEFRSAINAAILGSDMSHLR
jgi:hypothetical protein